jgi:hypothetical protein
MTSINKLLFFVSAALLTVIVYNWGTWMGAREKRPG